MDIRLSALRKISPILLLTAALVLPGLRRMASAQPASVSQPKWDEGDRWTWRRTNGSEYTHTVLRATSDGYSVHIRDTSSGISTVSIPLNFAPESFHFRYFQWPLEPGKRWTHKVSGQVGGRSVTWTITHSVVGSETVAAPAGTFDAMRISGHHCNDTMSGCADFSIWYGPKAKNVVRIAWPGTSYWPPDLRGSTELLIAYEVRTP